MWSESGEISCGEGAGLIKKLLHITGASFRDSVGRCRLWHVRSWDILHAFWSARRRVSIRSRTRCSSVVTTVIVPVVVHLSTAIGARTQYASVVTTVIVPVIIPLSIVRCWIEPSLAGCHQYSSPSDCQPCRRGDGLVPLFSRRVNARSPVQLG